MTKLSCIFLLFYSRFQSQSELFNELFQPHIFMYSIWNMMYKTAGFFLTREMWTRLYTVYTIHITSCIGDACFPWINTIEPFHTSYRKEKMKMKRFNHDIINIWCCVHAAINFKIVWQFIIFFDCYIVQPNEIKSTICGQLSHASFRYWIHIILPPS